MNDMKLIMEGWRSHLVKEHIKENLLEDHSYITGVLGISLPLNESGEPLPLTEELKNKIIEEQLLFEGFWSSIVDKAKDAAGKVKEKIISAVEGVKKFGKDGWRIVSSMYAAARNPEHAGKFTNAINKKMLRDDQGHRGITKVLKDLILRLPNLGMPTFAKMAQKAMGVLDSIMEKIKAMKGWKQLIGIAGFSIATKWLYGKVKGFVDPYLEMIQSTSKEKIAAWLKENLKDKLIDVITGMFPNVTQKLLSVASGIKPWWDAVVGVVGGMKLVIDALGKAAGRFSRVSLGADKIQFEHPILA